MVTYMYMQVGVTFEWDLYVKIQCWNQMVTPHVRISYALQIMSLLFSLSTFFPSPPLCSFPVFPSSSHPPLSPSHPPLSFPPILPSLPSPCPSLFTQALRMGSP